MRALRAAESASREKGAADGLERCRKLSGLAAPFYRRVCEAFSLLSYHATRLEW
jgi:hypothetical protein